MKAAVIALGVVSALLAFALYQRSASASRDLEAAHKEQHSLSNQVAEVRTRLALAQGTASQTVSNLQHHLDKRTGDLNIVSNRLVQTHLLLQAAQKEGRATQEQLQSRIAKTTALEIANEDLRNRASRTPEIEVAIREKAALRKQLDELTHERNALHERIGAMHVEMDTLHAQLFDLDFLERQRKNAEVAADIQRRMASARAGAAPDPRMKLELQPDGTVRYVDPRPVGNEGR